MPQRGGSPDRIDPGIDQRPGDDRNHQRVERRDLRQRAERRSTPNIAKPCANRPGQTVTVVLTATYNLDIPLVPGMTLNLSGNGSFRCE